jgi:hypothetical protein
MAHNKERSRVSVGDVDWSDPKLNELLKKTDGLSIDHRSQMPGTEVKIRVAGGWDTSAEEQSALLVADSDGLLVLVTRFPLSRGGEVQLSGVPGGGSQPLWAVVSDEREGQRIQDQGQELFLSWLRPR